MNPVSRPTLATVLVTLSIITASCGSGSSASTTGPPDDADAAAAAAADANIADLSPSDDIRRFEVLDVTTGGVTTMADAVDGDRPVLLWFWAPH